MRQQNAGWRFRVAVASSVTFPFGGGAFLHLLRRDVLYVRADPPLYTTGILDAAAAVAIKLIGRLLDRGRARRNRSLIERVDIFDVEANHAGGCLMLSARIGQHDHRIADSHLSMPDCVVRARHTEDDLCIESLFQKIDQLAGSFDYQIRGNCVIALWNGFNCHCCFSFHFDFTDSLCFCFTVSAYGQTTSEDAQFGAGSVFGWHAKVAACQWWYLRITPMTMPCICTCSAGLMIG